MKEGRSKASKDRSRVWCFLFPVYPSIPQLRPFPNGTSDGTGRERACNLEAGNASKEVRSNKLPILRTLVVSIRTSLCTEYLSTCLPWTATTVPYFTHSLTPNGKRPISTTTAGMAGTHRKLSGNNTTRPEAGTGQEFQQQVRAVECRCSKSHALTASL